MNELINRIKQFFKQTSKKEITAENARSLVFFRKELSYEEMINCFEEEAFKHLKAKAYGGYIYASILIPEWVKPNTRKYFLNKLKDLGYKYTEINELSLLIVYWNTQIN